MPRPTLPGFFHDGERDRLARSRPGWRVVDPCSGDGWFTRLKMIATTRAPGGDGSHYAAIFVRTGAGEGGLQA
jgi:hypothetical protein